MISKAFNSYVIPAKAGILILFSLCFNNVVGQLNISGSVTDGNGNPIQDAEVFIKQTQTLVITAENGAFVIENIAEGTYDVVVFAFEFRVLEQTLNLSTSSALNFQLEPLKTQELSEVVLTKEREKVFALQKLKTVEGTAVYAGKKSEVILVENLTGNLATNNARQVYNQVVGLNIYDNGDAGLQLNIGGRGLDPNRTANFNVRQNGYDISADALGYPESYYTPPVEALQQIQVVRGAASLQYGPQFGGLINFKLKRPNPDKKIEWVSRQTLGSFDLLTSFNSLSGTVGDFSYYTYFNYKEGNGFRNNSNFNSRNYFGHFGYQLSDRTKVEFETTFFNYLAKQAGGLTDLQFNEDPTFTNRARNWFNVDWKLFSLKLNHQFSSKTDFSLQFFGLDANRSALGYRENRVFAEDDLTAPRELLSDNFNNWGLETRLLTRHQLFDKKNILLVGAKYYDANNDQRQGPGSLDNAADFNFRLDEFPDYERQAQFTFPNKNVALFSENVFYLTDKFSITPGVRWEYIRTESDGFVTEIQTDLAGNVLLNEDFPFDRIFERNFFLLGVGLSYKPGAALEVYANFSENYRSVTFSDLRIVTPSFAIDPDITDEQGYTMDLGIRGRWDDKLSYDVSVFGLSYEDRIGQFPRTNTNIQVERFRTNVGDAFIYGLEFFTDWNLKSILNAGSEDVKANVFINLALTQSEYTQTNFPQITILGNKVEFVPEVNLKTGLNFGWKNLLGSLQYSFYSEQFTDATNAEAFLLENDPRAGIIGSIPAYDIMDLSLSYTWKKLKLEAGINNLLDNSYFTRRATGYPGPGIIPAEPRTFYTTLQFKL